LKRSVAKNHKVGIVSGDDATFGVFLKAGRGACLGEVVESFFDGVI
jgi:hypothetical protein